VNKKSQKFDKAGKETEESAILAKKSKFCRRNFRSGVNLAGF
jgi:hypothetical protein